MAENIGVLEALDQAFDELRDRVWEEVHKQIEECDRRCLVIEKLLSNSGCQDDELLEEEKMKRHIIIKSHMLWEEQEKKKNDFEKKKRLEKELKR